MLTFHCEYFHKLLISKFSADHRDMYKEKDIDGIQEWVLPQHHPKLGNCGVVEQTIDKVFF